MLANSVPEAYVGPYNSLCALAPADRSSTAFGAFAVAGIVFLIKPVVHDKNESKTVYQQLLEVDWIGSLLYVGASICILMPLQVSMTSLSQVHGARHTKGSHPSSGEEQRCLGTIK